jgi:hypothetical protein
MELAILRAMCQKTAGQSLLHEGRQILAGYRFAAPLHQVFFEALQAIPSNDPAVVREQLPATLTRRGVPDFDLDIFFQPTSLSREEVLDSMRRLAALTP